MIEKIECTCIEAYTTRKMRDPNCCACSCDHNDLVEQLAKANEAASFYKEQYENVDRECTKLAMLEAKANERAVELEGQLKSKDDLIQRCHDDVVIANERVKELEQALRQILGWRELRETFAFPVERVEDLCREQLRKEQESE